MIVQCNGLTRVHMQISHNWLGKSLKPNLRLASQITSLTIVFSTVNSRADQRKYQSSASLASVRGIHRWQVNWPHTRPVTRKMFPFDDVIMKKPTVSLIVADGQAPFRPICDHSTSGGFSQFVTLDLAKSPILSGWGFLCNTAMEYNPHVSKGKTTVSVRFIINIHAILSIHICGCWQINPLWPSDALRRRQHVV